MFTVRQTQEFQDWLDGLKDVKAQLRIVARLRLAETAVAVRDAVPVGEVRALDEGLSEPACPDAVDG